MCLAGEPWLRSMNDMSLMRDLVNNEVCRRPGGDMWDLGG